MSQSRTEVPRRVLRILNRTGPKSPLPNRPIATRSSGAARCSRRRTSVGFAGARSASVSIASFRRRRLKTRFPQPCCTVRT